MVRINSGRRLWAIWIAGSLCWVGYWIWHDVATCRLLRLHGFWAVSCRSDVTQPGGTVIMERTGPALPVLWHMLAQAAVLPLGLLIAGVVLQWALELRGGKRR